MSTADPVRPATTTAVPLGPDSWGPGGKGDPLIRHRHGLVGAPVSRLDGALKVTGRARFAAEVPMAGMLYAALAYSTIAKGRLATLDTTAAEAAPGVVVVMSYRNAPPMRPAEALFLEAERAAASQRLPVMQDDRIHWNGQPIAVVLGETQEQADHARALIRATYEVEQAVTAFEQAKARSHHPAPILGPATQEVGDAETALAAAPHGVELAYSTSRQNHNAIELHAATVAWDGDELTVHDCTQGVVHVAWSLAEMFGLEEKQVHVTAPFVGGGFGGKSLWQHQILAAAASKLAARPVRVMLSREGVYRVVGGRAPTEQQLSIGAQADGHFEALIHTGTAASSRHNNMPEMFTGSSQHLYSAANFKLDVKVADMDVLANTFMNAPGQAVGSVAVECAVDELAHRLGIDPIELRMRNEPDKDPTTGQPFSSRHLVEAYRMGAERFGWDKRDPTPSACREGEWLIGMGCATANLAYSRFPGGAARITLTSDGHAAVEVAAHEMGMGTATAQTQITAERLGLPLERVTFAYGDSSLPGVILAGGSQQTASVGAAVIAAQRGLVAELLELAGDGSPLANLTPDDVGAADGGLCNLEDPKAWESYVSILHRAQRSEVSVYASAPPAAEMKHWSMQSYGAQFCEVRVSAVTGETRVSRFVGSFDCGRILNPKTATSQFRGGIIMGLGLALMENTQLDERTGRIMNRSLAEYHVPVHMDVPQIDVIWTDIPDPHAPMGAHGIGEIGITGAAAAVANAIHNATGKRVREFPITLDKLL